MQKAPKWLFWFLPLLLLSCRETPEDYRLKAAGALKKENTAEAVKYLQTAYEVALSEDFKIPVKRRHFNQMEVSGNRDSFLFIEKDLNKNRSYVWVYHSHNRATHSVKFNQLVEYGSLSYQAQLAALLVRTAENRPCQVLIYDMDREITSETGLELACEEHPAITDQGLLYYTRENRVQIFDTRQKTGKSLETALKSPLEQVPAWAAFSEDQSGQIYFTFGSAGFYHFYQLKGEGVEQLSADVSSRRIYFIPGQAGPAVITGGASSHNLVFFHSSQSSEKIDIRSWRDLTFLGKDHFYFIEDNQLIEMKSGQETELPFWAVQIEAASNGDIYLLSPRGGVLLYSGKLPSDQVQAIFKEGMDLVETK